MNTKLSPDSFMKLRKLYDLDKPVHIRYLKWLSRVARFDFGESFIDNRPVIEKIAEKVPNTLILNILSMLLIFLIAVPIGIYSAVKQNTKYDKVFTFLSFFGYSFPSFWLALLLMMFFGVYLRVLPISGIQSPGAESLTLIERAIDFLKHLILPLFVSAFGGIAGISRFTRSSMLEVVRQDYIRTARAKGLPENTVIFKHAFRNALLPIITILGLSVPGLISGSFIFETIFAWPGMGRLGWESAMSFDYTVVMGVVTIGGMLTLAGNLIADIAYAAADPRIRY
jgi:peptide/nickel transport system permease protein